MKKRLFFLLILFTTTQAFALRDPTRPADYTGLGSVVQATAATPTKEAIPVVTSIIISPFRRIAVLDNEFVTEGDVIHDYKVVSIKEDYVVLSSDHNSFTVHLTSDITRTMGDHQ
jgi:hypothetical protein